MKKLWIIMLILFSATAFEQAFAQGIAVSGNVSGTWHAGSIILVNSDLTITDGETLIIEPGVNVQFQGHYKISVQGSIIAIGKKDKLIEFTKTDTTGFYKSDVGDGAWAGFEYLNTNAANASEFKYCVFEFSKQIGTNDPEDDGGVFCLNGFSNLTIDNCQIRDNKVVRHGGVFFLWNGSSPTITNSVIENNSAGAYGGVMYSSGNSNPDFSNNIVRNNTANGYGGAFSMFGSSSQFVNNYITANKSTAMDGGAFYLSGVSGMKFFGNVIAKNISGATGGAFQIRNSPDIMFMSNTIAENTANQLAGGIHFDNSSPDFVNTIIYGNLAGHVNYGNNIRLYDDASNPTFDYCVVEEGADGFKGTGAGVNYDATNLYTNIFSGDPGYLGDGDYVPQQQLQSICIDGGRVNETVEIPSDFDIDGNFRINNDIIDIGAYETQGTFCGTISSDMTIAGNYLVDCDITINNGVTLTIEPGTSLIFNNWTSAKIINNGTIVAIGTDENPIKFTSSATGQYPSEYISWGGIRMLDVAVTNDSTIFEHCIFEYGQAQGTDPDWNGGAIYAYNSKAAVLKLRIENCTFRRNKAQHSGGALYFGIYTGIFTNNTAPKILNNTFEENLAAWYGGALYHGYTDGVIFNNIFRQNRADYGGAIYVTGNGKPEIFSNLIVDNAADVGNGQKGGGIYYSNTWWSVKLANNTIANNTANYGGGVATNSDAQPSIYNNIIYGNTGNVSGSQIYLGKSSSTSQVIDYNILQGGLAAIGVASSFGSTFGSKNQDVDPFFDANSDTPYQLMENSPAINAAESNISGLSLPGKDVKNNPRIYNDEFLDAGAYEYRGPLVADAGVDIVSCDGQATMNATPHAHAIGEWTTDDTKINIVSPNSPTSQVTNLKVGLNYLTWTLYDNYTSAADEVMVNYVLLIADAGQDQIICNPEFALTTSTPSTGTGIWSAGNGSISIANPTSNSTQVTGVPVGDNTFTWTISHLGCSDSDNVIISNNQFSVSLGADITTCENTFELTAPDPSPGQGQWESEMQSTFSSPSSYITNITVTADMDWVGWQVFKDGCWAYDEIEIINDRPSIADVIDSYAVCGTDADIGATTPTKGTGEWSVRGTTPATIANSTQTGTYVTGLQSGENIFRWTITNNTCTQFAEVTITNDQIFASAQTSQTVCSTTASLSAEMPAGTTGNWENLSNASITNDTEPQTTVTGLSEGVNSFMWYIYNNNCTDEIQVDVISNPVTLSTSQIEVCENSASFPSVAAYNPAGEWKYLSGHGLIHDATSPSASVSSLPSGESSYQFVTNDGQCEANLNILNNEVTSNAGGNQNICETETTLAATDPSLIGASGFWTIVNNNASIPASDVYNASVTGLMVGENIFEWTVTKGNCEASSQVSIFNNSFTVDIEQIGEICETTAPLWGELPQEATGEWIPLNGGSVLDKYSNSTTVSGLSHGTYQFEWKVTKDDCTASGIVEITNNQVFAEAGNSPVEQCSSQNTITAANPNHGSGKWTKVGNTIATIASPTNNTTVVSGLGQGGQIFRWTVTEGLCTAYDEVTVINNSVIAETGGDISICGTQGSLNAVEPNFGTGQWTKLIGEGTIQNPELYNSAVTGITPTGAILQWTVTEGICTDQDNVIIVNNEVTAELSTYEPISICSGNTILPGIKPTLGTGTWTRLSGDGVIADETLYNSEVYGLGNVSNVFVWIVEKENCTDDISIEIINTAFTLDAGINQEVCEPVATLSGDVIQGGEGKWTTLGSATIVDDTQYNTQVSELDTGDNTFIWTVQKEGCNAEDVVVITNNTITVQTGGSVTVCDTHGQLNANNPALIGALGYWEASNQQVEVTTPSLYNSTVTNLQSGANSFLWTVTKGKCANEAEMVISNNAFAVEVEQIGEICDNTAPLWGELPQGGTGVWQQIAGEATTITNETSFNTTATGLGTGESQFKWLVNKDGCTASNIVTIVNNKVEAIVEGQSPYETCAAKFDLRAVAPNHGQGVWTAENQQLTFDDNTIANTTVRNLQLGSNVLTWTVTDGYCSDAVTIEILSNAVVGDAGIDITTCESTATLMALIPNQGAGEWSTTSPSITIENPTLYNSKVSGLTLEPATLTWTVKAGSCVVTDDVVVKNDFVAAEAQQMLTVCSTEATLNAVPNTAQYGVWENLSNATITNDTNAQTTVTNLAEGENKFQWYVYNNQCYDMAEVTVISSPVSFPNGNTVEVCESSVTLPTPLSYLNTGYWRTTGVAYIEDPKMLNPAVTNLKTGENLFIWTSDVANCEAEFTVVNNLVAATASENQTICSNETVIYAISDNNISGYWESASNATIANRTSAQTAVSNLAVGTNTFIWTVTKGNCTATTEVVVTNNTVNAEIGYQNSANVFSFNDLSEGIADSWHWNFGDGAYSAEQNPQHTFSKTGTFNVCLSVYNSTNSCFDRTCVKADNAAPLNAGFEYTLNAEIQTVSFANLSTGEITYYYWNFGDGNISANENPEHVYTNPGTYEVCLTVFKEEGQILNTYCETIYIEGDYTDCNIQTGFTYHIEASENKIILSNTTKGDATANFWTFDDGGVSTMKNPEYKYTEPGIYLITLSAADKDNPECFDGYAEYVLIGENQIMADFSYTVNSSLKEVVFLNESFGANLSYFWQFGDGITSEEESPKHVYTKTGVYDVTLTVSDPTGEINATVTYQIQINETGCTANFEYYVDTDNMQVFFKVTNVGDNLTYDWNFGDGNTSNEAEPLLAYIGSGYYTVSLTIENMSTGCISETKKTILIEQENGDVEAAFTYKKTGKVLNFKDNSIGDVASYWWNFGDETEIVKTKNPAHTYDTEGNYQVCLTVISNADVSNTTCENVIVGDDNSVLQAKFHHKVNNSSREVVFVDKSIGAPTKWEWSFGDGETSTEENPVHTYSTAGAYTVVLKVTDEVNGHESKTIQIVSVDKQGLYADFTVDVLETTNKYGGYPVEMVGAAFGDPAKFVWDFGDGQKDSTSLNQNHQYSEPGTYTVCFTVSDPITGLSDKKCYEVEIEGTSDILVNSTDTGHLSVYPNPSKGETNILFKLLKNSDINLSVYDIHGRLVDNLFEGNRNAGENKFIWKSAPKAGVYFVKLTTPQGVATQRIVVIE